MAIHCWEFFDTDIYELISVSAGCTIVLPSNGFTEEIGMRSVKLQDTTLLAKISAGDMLKQEAKYHTRCLVSLHSKAREVATSDERETYSNCYGLSYLFDSSHILKKSAWVVVSGFKLNDLTNIYTNRL